MELEVDRAVRSPGFCDKHLNDRFFPSMHLERDFAFLNSIRCTHLVKNLIRIKPPTTRCKHCVMLLTIVQQILKQPSQVGVSTSVLQMREWTRREAKQILMVL